MNKIATNRSFGILFFIVFLLIAIWPLLSESSIRVWSLIISLIFLLLGLINSKLLTPLKNIWIKLGEFLGKIIAPIIMGIIYFFIVTPIGLIMRIAGKYLINIKYSKEKSYWINRKKNIGPMNRQF
tara:strand:+ start:172 stop:549 length:378 start_codon:yes stop_codon:yes gene_type:complete